MVERLILCGVPERTAREIVAMYGDDAEGLETYVRTMEYFYDDRREYV